MEKNFLKSKTLWVNALVMICTLLGIKELAPEMSEEIIITVMAVVNIVLRFMTKSPIKLT